MLLDTGVAEGINTTTGLHTRKLHRDQNLGTIPIVIDVIKKVGYFNTRRK